MTTTNRVIANGCSRRPAGQVRVGDFARRDAPMPAADLAAGEILVRNPMLGFDPAQRGWMDDAPSCLPPTPIGEPVRGSAAARVTASANPAYPPFPKPSCACSAVSARASNCC
jgi:NADPH-dependent curcumin reductase CurA